jgi:hypothetical protein
MRIVVLGYEDEGRGMEADGAEPAGRFPYLR